MVPDRGIHGKGAENLIQASGIGGRRSSFTWQVRLIGKPAVSKTVTVGSSPTLAANDGGYMSDVSEAKKFKAFIRSNHPGYKDIQKVVPKKPTQKKEGK